MLHACGIPQYQAFDYISDHPAAATFRQFMATESKRFGDMIRRANLSF